MNIIQTHYLLSHRLNNDAQWQFIIDLLICCATRFKFQHPLVIVVKNLNEQIHTSSFAFAIVCFCSQTKWTITIDGLFGRMFVFQLLLATNAIVMIITFIFSFSVWSSILYNSSSIFQKKKSRIIHLVLIDSLLWWYLHTNTPNTHWHTLETY